MADFAISLAAHGRAPAAAHPLPAGVPDQELWLLADAIELKTVRRFAEAAAKDFGLDSDVRFRFVLAANEAVANAIEHGEPSPDGRLRLRISSVGDFLSFEVRDWGSFAVKWPKPSALQERGRGLAMMASLVDELDLQPSDGCTIVRLRVRAA